MTISSTGQVLFLRAKVGPRAGRVNASPTQEGRGSRPELSRGRDERIKIFQAPGGL
jgi:hypothetical protein